MNEIRVQIPYDVSADVERRFFEYNATKNILAYLMSRDDVLATHLEKYIRQAETRFTELELMKEQVTQQYAPEGLADYGYEFDFNKSEIVYKNN